MKKIGEQFEESLLAAADENPEACIAILEDLAVETKRRMVGRAQAADGPRDQVVLVHLSPFEKYTIQKAAGAAGQSDSDYLRDTALAAELKHREDRGDGDFL